MCFFRHLISPHVEGTSDKGNEKDTLLYGNMQKGVFLSFLFRYNKKKTVFTQLFVPQASQSSQDRRAEPEVRLAVPSAQSAYGMEDFMKLLIVVDMQNDFVTGSLGTKEAQAIVENVVCKIKETPAEQIYVTQDTHPEQYLQTKEGLHLPVAHCIEGTNGHCLCPAVEQALKEKQVDAARKIQKPTFGSMELIEKLRSDEKIVADSNLQIELVGLCTGICVLSNAILCKAAFPEADVIVDAAACACVTPASHDTALAAMKLCQIEVEKEGKEPWRN